MDLTNYFTEDKIIKLLCKYRTLLASKRHDLHMMRNFSIHPKSNKILSSQQNPDFILLSQMFPTRRNWKKLFKEERKKCKDSTKINQLRLYNSYIDTKKRIAAGSNTPVWYDNLISFASEISNEILNIQSSTYFIDSPKISAIKKDEKDGEITYRPIAVYDLKSKIICCQTAKYFTEFFDSLFLDCSHAFRARNSLSKQIPTHHDCIKKITYKRKRSKGLWAAECDIQKFFDIVNHDQLVTIFERLTKQAEVLNGVLIDSRSIVVLNLFLKSYSFQENILNLNGDLEWFAKNNLPVGKFGWVKKKLNTEFGSTYCQENVIGVPQGNAISCFVANLMLHEVDVKVLSSIKDIFYIRYCDDMILLHEEKAKCQTALESFMSGLKENRLLYHPPIPNLNYKQENSVFWNDSKSKLPYFWGDKNISSNNVPWLSFVGYQINFDGRIRVRKNTIEKETKKQVFETQKVIANLGKLRHFQEVANQHSRWSKRQITFSLHQRLISMSVGRVKLYNHKLPLAQGLCWTNGFKVLNKNIIASKQLRYLDRKRSHQIMRLKFALKSITRKSQNTTFKDDETFYGSAFSYFNFFKHKS